MLAAHLTKCQRLLEKVGDKSEKEFLQRFFETQLNKYVRTKFVEKFLAFFADKQDRQGSESYKPFLDGILFLRHLYQQAEKDLLKSNQTQLRDKLAHVLKVQILAQKPFYLNECLFETYYRAFRLYRNLERLKKIKVRSSNQDDTELQIDEEDHDDIDEYDFEPDEGACYGCNFPQDGCKCSVIYEQFLTASKFLREFGLLEGLVGDTVLNVARVSIEKKVAALGKRNYACSYIDELCTWTHCIVKAWVSDVYGSSKPDDIQQIGVKLDGFLKDAYADVRVAHMFEIIIEYPNSEAAVQDLRVCLEKSTSPSFRLNLIENVKKSLIDSLLHTGVNTYDILTAYISAIKALRALDPTGLILQLVTEPVRKYLKSREDTVRCIVTALTDEEHHSELNREMMRSSAPTCDNAMIQMGSNGGSVELTLPCEGERCTASNFEKWKPDPIKLSCSDEQMKSSRFADIVSILVNIYETKDLFVEEYQKLLSQRLLVKYDECNLDSEVRNLELLTIRFSDCELHRCEVMLKDVQTSKRINKRILSGDVRGHKLDRFKNLDVLIVSSPFWPEKFNPLASVDDEPPFIEFPSEIESAIKTYTKAFESIQASRTLHWRHHLGSVNMDVTIKGKTSNFTVSPLHAAILYLFKEKKVWQITELTSKTSLPSAIIRSRLSTWVRNGLISDNGEGVFSLID